MDHLRSSEPRQFQKDCLRAQLEYINATADWTGTVHMATADRDSRLYARPANLSASAPVGNVCTCSGYPQHGVDVRTNLAGMGVFSL